MELHLKGGPNVSWQSWVREIKPWKVESVVGAKILKQESPEQGLF